MEGKLCQQDIAHMDNPEIPTLHSSKQSRVREQKELGMKGISVQKELSQAGPVTHTSQYFLLSQPRDSINARDC